MAHPLAVALARSPAVTLPAMAAMSAAVNPFLATDPASQVNRRGRNRLQPPGFGRGVQQPGAADLAEAIAGFLPVSGEILSARDAVASGTAMADAIAERNAKEALIQGGLTGLNALGTVPLVGMGVRTTHKGAEKLVDAIEFMRRKKKQQIDMNAQSVECQV